MNSRHVSTISKKHQEWQFRDQVIPARVFHLLKTNEISGTDIIILAVINSLVKCQDDSPGMGCWASNKYLASAANVHETYISQRLKHLCAKKLIIIIYMENQRYLETEWARTGEEILELEGEYGDAYRKARNSQIGMSKGGKGKHLGGVKENLKGALGKHKAPPLGKPKAIYNDKELSNNMVGKNSQPRSIPFGSNGETPIPLQLAKKLYQILQKKNKIMRKPQMTKWSEEFRQLLQLRPLQEVQEALDWYDSKGLGKPYVPQPYSAKAFRDKFVGIEDAMIRSKDKAKSYKHEDVLSF